MIRYFFIACLLSLVSYAEPVSNSAQIPATNYIKVNPNAENGIAGWAKAGNGTFSRSTATKAEGAASFLLNATDSSFAVTSSAYNIDGSLGNRNAAFIFKYLSSDASASNMYAQVLDGANAVLLNKQLQNTNGVWQEYQSNFIAPSIASNLKVKFLGVGSSTTQYIDSVGIYEASRVNLSSVTPSAEIYATISYAGNTNCSWSTGDTSGAMTDYAADTDCQSAVVTGNCTVPSTKVPQIVCNNLPAGKYKLTAINTGLENTSNAASFTQAFYDGSTYFGHLNYYIGGAAEGTQSPRTLVGDITYNNAQSSVTFKIKASSSSNSNDPTIANSYTNGAFKIIVERFPTQSEVAFRPEVQNKYGKVSIASNANHLFSTTSATYVKVTDTDVVSGDKTHTYAASISANANDYAFIISSIPQGILKVDLNGSLITQYSSSDTTCAFGISDDACTTVKGEVTGQATSGAGINYLSSIMATFEYSSVQSSKEFVICAKRVSGGGTCYLDNRTTNTDIIAYPLTYGLPLPNFIGSVTSPSSGQISICSGLITNTGSPSVTRSDGNCAASVTDNNVGDVSVNFASGTFSSAPNCSASLVLPEGTPSVAGSRVLNIYGQTTSQLEVYTYYGASSGGAMTDYSFSFMCIGQK